MLTAAKDEEILLKELVEKLSEFNKILKDDIGRHRYHYAFDPSVHIDRETYSRNIKIIEIIYEVLDENLIKITSQGYTYLKDAVCIIIDLETLDICLASDIYPSISRKYKLSNSKGNGDSKVEHSIRNCLDSAYKRCKKSQYDKPCIMTRSHKKPTNKAFILELAKEVKERMEREQYS